MEQMELIVETEKAFWEDLKSGKFARMVREASRGEQLSSSAEAYHIVKPLFAEQDDVERLYGIFLDNKNHILAIEVLSSGSLTSAAIYPREVVKRLIALKSAALILAHNHPAGSVEPSREDYALTRKIALAADSIDVRLLDHIIVGEGYHSFSDSGFLKAVGQEIQFFLKGPRP